MNSSHQGEIVLTESGEIQNPITVDVVSVIVKVFCCSIGIPLNASIAAPFICLRHLRCRPRNCFLLAIILSYLSFFIVPVIELIYWALYPDESVCHAYIAVMVLPQGLLLTNMLLALIDRYLAINHPLLHREKMTNRLAGYLVITCSMLMVFLMKFVYIARLGILRCEVWLVHIRIILAIMMTLFAACLVLNVIIYRQTKILLRESRTLQVTQDERVSSSANANNQPTVFTPMCIHADREKLGEMEMEATRTLVIGVTSLCVMPCLALIFILSYLVCRLVFGQVACGHLYRLLPWIKELNLTPAVYGPIIFLVRNKELRAAWACAIVLSH